MPGILVLRPADFNEVVECWRVMMGRNGPSVIVLTRQSVSQITNNPKVHLGAYDLEDNNKNDVDVTIFASGSELSIALQTKKILQSTLKVRVVSVVCFELFFEQKDEYIESLLGGDDLKVGIEAASSFGWHKIIGRNGMFFGIDSFGASAPSKDLYNFFNLTPEKISERILDKASRR
jgi:transketolase